MGIGGFIYSLVDYNIVYFIVGIFSKYFDILVFMVVKKGNWKELI